MNHQIHSTYRVALLVLVGILFIGFTPVKADTVLIDFGTATGSTTLSGGNTWNTISVVTSTPQGLTDTAGISSGISIAGTNFLSSGTNLALPAIGIWPTTATGDYMYVVNGSSGTVTLSGLNPTFTYNLSYDSDRANNTYPTDTAAYAGLLATGTPEATGHSSGANDATAVVSWTGLTSDASGNLTISLTPSVGSPNIAVFNVFQIDAVATPEPSTIALSILGGLGLFAVVIRRRQLAQI